MALAEAVQGATHVYQDIGWSGSDGAPEDLSGATLAGTIRSYQSGQTRPIAGALTLLDAAGGLFRWQYDAGDVAASGLFQVQFTAAFGDGTVDRSFAEDWTVEAEL